MNVRYGNLAAWGVKQWSRDMTTPAPVQLIEHSEWGANLLNDTNMA